MDPSLDLELSENFFNLGNVYYSDRRSDKAIECYYKAIELNPFMAQAYNRLGNLYIELGNTELAEKYFQQEKLLGNM